MCMYIIYSFIYSLVYSFMNFFINSFICMCVCDLVKDLFMFPAALPAQTPNVGPSFPVDMASSVVFLILGWDCSWISLPYHPIPYVCMPFPVHPLFIVGTPAFDAEICISTYFDCVNPPFHCGSQWSQISVGWQAAHGTGWSCLATEVEPGGFSTKNRIYHHLPGKKLGFTYENFGFTDEKLGFTLKSWAKRTHDRKEHLFLAVKIRIFWLTWCYASTCSLTWSLPRQWRHWIGSPSWFQEVGPGCA